MSERTEVHVAEIVDSRWQTRQDGYSGPEFEELVASVREHGIVNPPGVFVNEGEEYELVYGHRRLGAARKAGLTVVPISVIGNLLEGEVQRQLDRFQQRVIADNLYHENLTPLELAQALKDLIELQGLSQKQVAEIYGKSQQWVSDKVHLLDLAPEVQTALTERAVEESVARKLATLPEEYQKPVADYVKGKTSRDANYVIQQIADASDPAYWDLPEDKPWSPQQINVKAMMDDCLERVPKEKMGQALIGLSEGHDLVLPESRGPWAMDRITRELGLKAQPLTQWQIEHGRTCEVCLFQGEDLFYGCGRQDTRTCENCLTLEDPIRLPKPDLDGGCQECEGSWCVDVSCYIQKVKAARKEDHERKEEAVLESSIQRLDEIRAFYDRQLSDEVDNDHWLAQACQHCADFRGPDQREQCGWEQAGDQDVAFWQSEGTIVPRCSAWQLRDPQRIPEIDQSCFEQMLLVWIEATMHNGRLYAYLPGDDGEDKMEYLRSGALNRKQLAALLNYATNPELSNWGPVGRFLHPVTGEISVWQLVEDEDAEEIA